MIVVQETNVSQTFDFIPRYGTPVTLELTDENTNVMVVVTGVFTGGDYVHSFSGVLPTEENHFYWMVLKDGGKVASGIFQKVGCLQTLDNRFKFYVRHNGNPATFDSWCRK